MKGENIKVKKEFIVAFYDEFEKKISNIKQIIEQSFIQEALILACCYIGALANFRYGISKERDGFVKVIYEYSSYKNLYSKISWIYFYKTGKNPSEKDKKGKPISNYEEIKVALLKIYGKKSNHHQEMDKNGVINYLKNQISNLALNNLETNLDMFSYAAVLYEKYRCAGVHVGSIATSWDVETGDPLFERNDQGEDIYYSENTLCFSKEIILATL